MKVEFRDGSYYCGSCGQEITHGGGQVDRQVVEVVNHAIDCIIPRKLQAALTRALGSVKATVDDMGNA